MGYDAFLSYNHGDLPWAEKLRDALAALGKAVFLDTANLRTGTKWEPALQQALLDSRSIVLLWSDTNAANSRWVTTEAAAFRAFMFAEEKKGGAARRQLIQVCLEGRNTDYTSWQLIDDLNDGAQYKSPPDQVDANRWQAVLDKIVDALEYDEAAPVVHLLIAASVRDEIEKIPVDATPVYGAKTFGQLLTELGMSKTDVAQLYGKDRAEWRPFRGEKNIRTVLSQVQSEIGREGGPKFRWKPVPDAFWTAPLRSPQLVEIERTLKQEPSVVVVDAISMYDPLVFARCQRLVDCVYNQFGSLLVLPPFAFEQREILRSTLDEIAHDLHDKVWIPQFVEGRMVRASCALTAPDQLEIRRLLASALWQSKREYKHWSVVVGQ